MYKVISAMLLTTSSFNAFSISCPPLPHFIIDSDILSCRLLQSSDNPHNLSVLLEVEVRDEILFNPVRPINWDELKKQMPVGGVETLKGKTVRLVIDEKQYSCNNARFRAESNIGETFMVRQLCCVPGVGQCKDTNYRASLLPYKKAFLNSE